MKQQAALQKIFYSLLNYYGPRKWWPARTRFEVIIGAILTQNVSWRNAKKAVSELKKNRLLSVKSILSNRQARIASLIKSSRFYNQKARNIQGFCKYLVKKYNGSLDRMFAVDTAVLRTELLALRGIGKETADSILLYAGKKMIFVSDAKIRDGIVEHINIISPTCQNLTNLEVDLEEFEKMGGFKNLNNKEREDKIKMLIRAYDPCVTCAVH